MSKLAQDVQRMCAEIYAKKPVEATPTRKKAKKAKKAVQSDVVMSVHDEVWALDPACICGSCKPAATDEMHELNSRAKTRGMAPEIRFSTKNCVRLSRKCHAMVTGEVGHGKRLKIQILDDTLGANGPLLLTWKTGKLVTYQRKQADGAMPALPA